jgi:hypothetical protein
MRKVHSVKFDFYTRQPRAPHLKLEMTSALTHAPSENAPGVQPLSFLQIHRAAIGIEYAR